MEAQHVDIRVRCEGASSKYSHLLGQTGRLVCVLPSSIYPAYFKGNEEEHGVTFSVKSSNQANMNTLTSPIEIRSKNSTWIFHILPEGQ